MRKDFRDFTKEDFKSEQNFCESIPQNDEQVGEYEDLLNQYKDMDNGQLMNELYKQASKMKANGTLTQKTIDDLYSTLSPYINDEQKQVLSNILNSLL